MEALPEKILPRVGQLVRVLASSHDGEALSACRALGRMLTSVGRNFHDLADQIEHPPTPAVRVEYRDRPQGDPGPLRWSPYRRGDIAEALGQGVKAGIFGTWEREFVSSVRVIMASGGKLSDRQVAIVNRLLAKVQEART